MLLSLLHGLNMSHLLVAISPHGFGHLAQVAPVINRLREILPELVLTLRTTLPRHKLEQRIQGAFTLQEAADDFGMQQRNALEVDLPASLERYRMLHANWPQEVERVAAELDDAGPDLILADVPYLTLAAARQAGIRSVAMCSLNWEAILRGYLGQDNGVEPMLKQMRAAYNRAEAFLCPAPSMPMPGLENIRHIGVVAMPASKRREQLIRDRLVDASERLVLIAMGGIDHRLPLERWPAITGVRFVVPEAWQIERSDCLGIESSGLGFSDLLASVDLVITKPGYGTFTEAALNGIPLLYVRRGDWPEEPCLIEWLQQHGRCMEISRDALELGAVSEPLLSLLRQKGPAPVAAEGVSEAASLLQHMLEEYGVGD